MKQIKIHLQYPWKFPDSSYYKNILEYPPKDVAYVNYKKSNKPKIQIIGSSKKFEVMRRFKNFLRKILNILRLPNLTYTFNPNCDLIHCAHCLSLNKKPWVVDTEVWDRVSAGGKIAESKLGKWIIKNRLESEYCKRIICWSEDCKKSFEKAFLKNKKILDKIEILHFGLPLKNFKKIPHKNLRILFVARWFDAKGGRQTLYVFNELSKKYPDIEFTFICPTPKEFKEKYSQNKQINIMDLIPQEKLFKEIYPSADIFFYPGFGDSYGFAVPEAMAYELPIVTSNTFAKKELLKNGKYGLLVDLSKDWKKYYYECMNKDMLNEFIKKTEILINDKKLREKIGKEARKEVINGMFSIEKRNRKLRDIYEEALK
ncbi:MAG TPA: glycosyltransferase family 4 protein [Candidatus Nanoarchaeia archaeon]|nr:glycosyltransferase family 4 protein [Candidatus Nanoarchaeia archaeon]